MWPSTVTAHEDVMVFHDDYQNVAFIQPVKVFPYFGSEVKRVSYRLIIKSDYEQGFVYFVSVYETKEQALQKLNEISNGSFRQVVDADGVVRYFNDVERRLKEEMYGIR